ncbi:hypothetical protein SBDP2_400014 [Syntrophobacter sp. SbD2]|nr:hypothetical protein SBDP2_400014 [Syntrophobacter sp. SbD2]
MTRNVEKKPADPEGNPSSVALSNPDRMFYPEIGVTKRALAEYYTEIAGLETVKSFPRAVSESIVREAPGEYVCTMSKEKRKGKIFIDYLRNVRGATSIAPYSTRSRQGAPISMPVAWDELTVDLKSDSYNIRNSRRRLAGLQQDPWTGYFSIRQEITQEMKING